MQLEINSIIKKQEFNPIIMDDLSEIDIENGKEIILQNFIIENTPIKPIDEVISITEQTPSESHNVFQTQDYVIASETTQQYSSFDGSDEAPAGQVTDGNFTHANLADFGNSASSLDYWSNGLPLTSGSGTVGNSSISLEQSLQGIWTLNAKDEYREEYEGNAVSSTGLMKRYDVKLHYKKSQDSDQKYHTVEDEIFNRIFNQFHDLDLYSNASFKQRNFRKRNLSSRFVNKGFDYEANIEIEVPNDWDVKNIFGKDFIIAKINQIFNKPLKRE